MKFKDYFKKISNKSFYEFHETCEKVIEEISRDRELICAMLDNIVNNEKLIQKSECYDFLDKFVCFSDDEMGIHARISLFNEKYANRIHYHRWNYSACVLKGGYKQLIYGDQRNNSDEITHLYPYEPVIVENILPGNIYSLEHSIIHSILAQPDTISLCIRGKAIKDRFQVLDPVANISWWQYGSELEGKEEQEMKSTTIDDLEKRIVKVKSILMSNIY